MPNRPQRDLYETYLPAFEAAVCEGQVGSVMGAYAPYTACRIVQTGSC